MLADVCSGSSCCAVQTNNTAKVYNSSTDKDSNFDDYIDEYITTLSDEDYKNATTSRTIDSLTFSSDKKPDASALKNFIETNKLDLNSDDTLNELNVLNDLGVFSNFSRFTSDFGTIGKFVDAGLVDLNTDEGVNQFQKLLDINAFDICYTEGDNLVKFLENSSLDINTDEGMKQLTALVNLGAFNHSYIGIDYTDTTEFLEKAQNCDDLKSWVNQQLQERGCKNFEEIETLNSCSLSSGFNGDIRTKKDLENIVGDALWTYFPGLAFERISPDLSKVSLSDLLDCAKKVHNEESWNRGLIETKSFLDKISSDPEYLNIQDPDWQNWISNFKASFSEYLQKYFQDYAFLLSDSPSTSDDSSTPDEKSYTENVFINQKRKEQLQAYSTVS